VKALHSKKVADEKDAFFGELLASLPKSKRLKNGGDLAARARRLHERFIAVHILSHYKPHDGPLITDYFEMVASLLIECECLLALGFYNSGMMVLRASVEASIKLLYYETHPIEWQLHQAGKFDLHGNEYREFLYSVPAFSGLPFFAKNSFEPLWTGLCKFVHGDLKAIAQVGVVGDIKTVLGLAEPKFVEFLSRLREANKVIIACCFAVDPKWLLNVEKAYFDAVLEVYTTAERSAVKDKLRIV
jgi:hypothetical protein